jgi:ABC-2 type transport system permease protein
VYALFLVGDLAMRDILTESEAGTLRRQIQGPVSPGGVLVAKAVFSASVAFISLIILSLIGWIASDGPIDMLGFLVLSLALILAVVGSAAAIYGAAGKLQRGAVISSIVYLFLAFAGGSFFSVEGMPGVVRLIAPISPFYWGTQGYRALLGQGASLTDILPSVGVLSAIGLVFLILGGLLLNRNLVRGGGA